MDRRTDTALRLGDITDSTPPVAPRNDAPSAPSTTSPAPGGVDEIRELNKRTAALETMIASLIEAMHTSKQGTLAPTSSPDQTPVVPSDQASSHASEDPPSTTLLHGNPTGHSSTISKTAVRDALELVPRYDGHNISVLQFARACKRAKELVHPSEEGALVRFLRGKLANHAYMAIEDETHDTVDQLLESLKKTFSPARTPNFYRGQLSVVHKKPSEHVLDYVGRVKDLRSAIVEGDQISLGRDLSRPEILALDTDVIESFFDGLPPHFRAELKMDGCASPTEAYSRAITVAKRLERDQMYGRDSRAESSTRDANSDPRFLSPAPRATNSTAREPPPVTILRRDQNLPPAMNSRAPRASNNPFPNTRKVCGYCNKFGHLMFECNRRKNDDVNINRSNQGNAPAAPASESRGRQNRQAALPFEDGSLPSTSSDPRSGRCHPSS